MKKLVLSVAIFAMFSCSTEPTATLHSNDIPLYMEIVDTFKVSQNELDQTLGYYVILKVDTMYCSGYQQLDGRVTELYRMLDLKP